MGSWQLICPVPPCPFLAAVNIIKSFVELARFFTKDSLYSVGICSATSIDTEASNNPAFKSFDTSPCSIKFSKFGTFLMMVMTLHNNIHIL